MDEDDYYYAYQEGRDSGYDEGYEDALKAIDFVWLAENYRGVNYVFIDYDKAMAWFYKQLKRQGFDAGDGDYIYSYDIDVNKSSMEAFTSNGDLIASLIPYEVMDDHV